MKAVVQVEIGRIEDPTNRYYGAARQRHPATPSSGLNKVCQVMLIRPKLICQNLGPDDFDDLASCDLAIDRIPLIRERHFKGKRPKLGAPFRFELEFGTVVSTI